MDNMAKQTTDVMVDVTTAILKDNAAYNNKALAKSLTIFKSKRP
jgi:hypothetical protein